MPSRVVPACLLLLFAPYLAFAEPASEKAVVNANSVVAYVQSCRKPNGAFGPLQQEYTDAAWNYPAVRTLLVLGETVQQPEKVLASGLGFPPGHGGYGHWQFFHEHQIRALLKQPIEPAHRQINVVFDGYEPSYYGSPFGAGGAGQFKAAPDDKYAARDKGARELGYYNLSSLYYLLAGMKASNRAPSNSAELVQFITARQAPNGGFVDVRSATAEPLDSETHLAHTYHAVAALNFLGSPVPHARKVAEFVHSCQVMSGAYSATSAKQSPDVYYTWCALNTLALLGERPQRVDTCTQAIRELQNSDGGFGDQPGWRSRLYSTMYAVESLQLLTGDARKAIESKEVAHAHSKPIVGKEFRIYQALFKVPVVQPDDLAGLSKRGFHLLGLKSDKFEDAEQLLTAIREQKLAMDVVLCPEAYPHRLQTRGGLVLNHVGNFTLDPRWNAEQRRVWRQADQAGKESRPWSEYQQQVLQPLAGLNSLSYPEQDFELEHAYEVYDRNGYNAMLAGFNWAPRDFVRVFPWRERYLDKLALIADADSHGDLAKWSPQLDHTRNLFIARGPTYADFLEAATQQRVVCVIAQPSGVAAGFSCYGPAAAVDYVRERVNDWRWWQDGE
ncbi:Prenyltransferase and squalene oxidase repeat protein [Anatilimnocola aggregata]|uniref:Geranylgeranyl transferase type II subunit beta n=1 Tax=Anatilimnocola aggregata TaxID=2528021 RepID=A0A517YEI3_9BACT|nr:prenyltransferase/squalene oxidase repeat-containing protein [Anatilimnocola aggregata]QDU28655.1 Prenyltransferase and squalene oxidase repeat protein [Anatilimnocola aggregata]